MKLQHMTMCFRTMTYGSYYNTSFVFLPPLLFLPLKSMPIKKKNMSINLILIYELNHTYTL